MGLVLLNKRLNDPTCQVRRRLRGTHCRQRQAACLRVHWRRGFAAAPAIGSPPCLASPCNMPPPS